MLAAGLIIFFAPLLSAIAVGLALPEQARLYGAIAAYLLAAFASVSVASEYYHGRLRTVADIAVAVGHGGTCGLIAMTVIGSLVAIAWLMSRLT